MVVASEGRLPKQATYYRNPLGTDNKEPLHSGDTRGAKGSDCFPEPLSQQRWGFKGLGEGSPGKCNPLSRGERWEKFIPVCLWYALRELKCPLYRVVKGLLGVWSHKTEA